MHKLLLLSVLAASAVAQSNTVAGLEGRITNNASPTLFGRRGPAYPNGEIGMSYSYTMCNPGTVSMAWSAPMNPNHPMFAFSIVRESNGRLEQITNNATTFVKHAFAAANTSSVCGTYTTTGTGLRVGCSDTYGASTNASRTYLGPSNEIDPWTGIWTPVGSYFDRSEPDVGAPANSDGVRSLTNSTGGVFVDPVKNRVTLREQDLLVPGRLFHCMHIIVRGEDGDSHFDNLGHRQFTAVWNGTTWQFANTGVPFTNGSVLNQWAGATVNSARNGEDDGHFLVASKATDNGNGTWHYEYIVQNFDNARGGATLRIPMCYSTTATNVSFRDTDGDVLNEWTWSRVGNELVFSAPANNPLDWNTMFNFSFDCNVAPIGGAVTVDQARIGAGALSIDVASQIPSGIAQVTNMGPGCGVPLPTIAATGGLPVIPNAGFGLQLTADAGSLVFLLFSTQSANLDLGLGCTQYVDSANVVGYGTYVTDGSGVANVAVPVPNDLAFDGVPIYWQSAQKAGIGPVYGHFTISNGLVTRFGCR